MLKQKYLITKNKRFFKATNHHILERVWDGDRRVVAHLIDMIISRHIDAIPDEEYYPEFDNEFMLYNHQDKLANTVSDMVICEYHINKNLLINELGYQIGRATTRTEFNKYSHEKCESVS